MIWDALRPEGRVYWISAAPGNLIGSTLVILRLRDAAQNGLDGFYNSEAVSITLDNPSDVRFALELFYSTDAVFSDSAPKPTPFYEPINPEFIY